jgi:hypothetical protein
LCSRRVAFAKEADEVEGVPLGSLGAIFLTNGATTATATSTTAVIEFRPDMMGDDFIKVVRENRARERQNIYPDVSPGLVLNYPPLFPRKPLR